MFNNFCNLDYIALAVLIAVGVAFARSEERRVGKECRL